MHITILGVEIPHRSLPPYGDYIFSNDDNGGVFVHPNKGSGTDGSECEDKVQNSKKEVEDEKNKTEQILDIKTQVQQEARQCQLLQRSLTSGMSTCPGTPHADNAEERGGPALESTTLMSMSSNIGTEMVSLLRAKKQPPGLGLAEDVDYDMCFVFPIDQQMVTVRDLFDVLFEACHHHDHDRSIQLKSPSGNPLEEALSRLSPCYVTPELSTIAASKNFDDCVDMQGRVIAVFLRILDVLECNYSAFVGEKEPLLFIKVQMRETGLRRVAHHQDYVLSCNPDLARKVLKNEADRKSTVPYFMYDARMECILRQSKQHEKIFARYNPLDGDICNDGTSYSLFRPVDRIRLLSDAINDYFELNVFAERGLFNDWYPLHQWHLLRTKEMLDWETASCSVFKKSLLKPLMHKRQVRDYFGEEYALYFSWLAMYTALLGPLAAFGTILFILQLWRDVNLQFEDPIIRKTTIFFSLFVACWTVYLSTKWINQETMLGLRWGMILPSGAEPILRQRPEFKEDKWIIDRVHPYLWVKHASKAKQKTRRALSSFIIGVSVIVAALIANSDLQGTVALPRCENNLPEFLLSRVGVPRSVLYFSVVPYDLLPLSSIITAVVVKIVEAVYQSVAEAAVRLENWQYEVDHFDSHIVKRFTFVNLDYFSSMIYIAFFKRYATGAGDEVLHDLRSQLLAQWAIECALNIYEMQIPRLIFKWRTAGMKGLSDVERQYYLPVHEGTLEEYIEMVTQLGLVTLFSSVLPIIPALIWVTNHWEIRLDASKLMRSYRRPYPQMAWNRIMRMLSLVVMFLNLALCVFSTVGRNLQRRQQLRLMLVVTIIGMAVREIIEVWVSHNYEEETQFCQESAKVEEAILWSNEHNLSRRSIFSRATSAPVQQASSSDTNRWS